jgi:hypothetical protein
MVVDLWARLANRAYALKLPAARAFLSGHGWAERKEYLEAVECEWDGGYVCLCLFIVAALTFSVTIFAQF